MTGEAEANRRMIKFLQRQFAGIVGATLVIVMARSAVAHIIRFSPMHPGSCGPLFGHIGVAGLAPFRGDALKWHMTLHTIILKVKMIFETFNDCSLRRIGRQLTRAEDRTARNQHGHPHTDHQYQPTQTPCWRQYRVLAVQGHTPALKTRVATV